MKKVTILVSAIALGIIVLSSCNGNKSGKENSDETTLKDVQQEMLETQKTINDYLYENKEELIAEANKDLKKADKKIDDLEQNLKNEASELSEAANKTKEEQIQNIKDKRDELKTTIDELKGSTSDAWEDIKKGFSKASDALAKSFEEAEKEYSNDK